MPNITLDKKRKIAAKKLELKQLRKDYPEKTYPPVWDELIDAGYLYLYDHLKHMRDTPSRNARLEEINKLSFSTLSHIVLEAREAIIQQVLNSIPPNPRKIIFLIGGTGAGKSTTWHFLSGAEMELEHFAYKIKNNKDSYIGHDDAQSCTFLPNIKVIDDVVIIDFPGFEDTNETIISLITELTFKALLNKYAKYDLLLLVIEAITNTEDRYKAAAELGLMLSRLIADKTVCTLGITKYSKDADFQEIKSLLEKQKQELAKPYKTAKIELTAAINTLTSFLDENPNNSLEITQKIQQDLIKKQLQLSDLEQNIYQLPNEQLTEFKRKIKEHEDKILEKEKELLKQIGLNKILRFFDLEDPDNLNSCMKALLESPKQSIEVNPRLPLNARHENFLDARFTKDLMKDLNSGYIHSENTFKDFDSFKECLQQHSLMYAITSPEIKTFLSLPEIDPNLVKKFDDKFITDCTNKYLKALADLCCNLTVINTFINIVQENPNVIELKNQIARLEYNTKLFLFENDENWNKRKRNYKSAANFLDHELPKWVNTLSYMPTLTPETINSMTKGFDIKNAHQTISNELLEKYSSEIKNVLKIFFELKKIENICSQYKINVELQEKAKTLFTPSERNEKDDDKNIVSEQPKGENYLEAKKIKQMQYQTVYDKQVVRHRLFTKLVLASIALPPLLLITLPLWFFAKRFEKIKMISISTKEENEIRLKRRAWKSTQCGLLKIKNNSEMQKDSSETIITKYVDVGRYQRDRLFKTRNPNEITNLEIENTQRKSATIISKIKISG